MLTASIKEWSIYFCKGFYYFGHFTVGRGELGQLNSVHGPFIWHTIKTLRLIDLCIYVAMSLSKTQGCHTCPKTESTMGRSFLRSPSCSHRSSGSPTGEDKLRVFVLVFGGLFILAELQRLKDSIFFLMDPWRNDKKNNQFISSVEKWENIRRIPMWQVEKGTDWLRTSDSELTCHACKPFGLSDRTVKLSTHFNDIQHSFCDLWFKFKVLRCIIEDKGTEDIDTLQYKILQ